MHEPQRPGFTASGARPSPRAPGRGLTPEGVRALQRAAGNRATRQYLQRMVVAIDGDTDPEPSKAATRACLWNLRYRKGGKDFVDGGARGAVAGPNVLRNLSFHMRPMLKSDGESIYVLGHGSRWSPEISGMDPPTMAEWLRARFGKRDWRGPLGWLGLTTNLATPFTGKIKLVSCHSAAEKRHRVGKDEELGAYPFSQSYAEALARALKPQGKDDPFQPSSVQGVNGIGWVDEVSGRITAIDKTAYDAAMKQMKDNSDVGSTGAGKAVNPFTSESDPAARGAGIHALFGKPAEAKVAPAGGLRTGKGDWGKRRFEVGTGKEI